jgi:hypothetical protein
MRRTTSAAFVAALGITLTTILAAPAGAAPSTGASSPSSCTGATLTTADLATGCVVDSGRLVLPDGRSFAVPAAGTSVAALPVVSSGAADGGDVLVTNTGSAGVAVRIDDTWAGSPAAISRERATTERRTLSPEVRGTVGSGATTTAATTAASTSSCTNGSYTLAGHRWNKNIGWRYNSANEKTLGRRLVTDAANAWTGRITACGRTVTSGASASYVGTSPNQSAVRTDGGCGAPDRTNVVGWSRLPAGVLGVTCVFSGSGGIATETDQRYSTGQEWSTTTVCRAGRFDIRGVATHEWGHAYGLGHTSSSSNLVMKPSTTTCDTAQRTLGYGDLRGIDALY